MSVIRGTYSDVPGIPSESCPVFSGRGPDSVIYVTDPTKKNYNYTQCEYPSDIADFMTYEDITLWKTRFVYTTAYDPISGLEVLNTVLLPQYCSTSTSFCPPDPITGQQPEECSQFLNTKSADCQLWAIQYPTQADIVKQQWCAERTYTVDDSYIGPSECDCINRDLNPIWQYFHENPELPESQDHCWYLPCANPSFYLPLSTDTYSACPDVCGIIVRQIGDNPPPIVIPPEDPYINCNLDTNKSSSSIIQSKNMINKIIDDPTSKESFTVAWVLIGILILAVIGVIIIIKFIL